MTLDKWTTGDTITDLNINKRSIRRGTTSDRDALSATEIAVGDHFFNEDEECTQVLVDSSPVIWMNVGRILLGADSNEVAVTGNTATQVKDIDVIKHTSTWAGFLIVIVVRMKSSASDTASLRCRLNGGGSDSEESDSEESEDSADIAGKLSSHIHSFFTSCIFTGPATNASGPPIPPYVTPGPHVAPLE